MYASVSERLQDFSWVQVFGSSSSGSGSSSNNRGGSGVIEVEIAVDLIECRLVVIA